MKRKLYEIPSKPIVSPSLSLSPLYSNPPIYKYISQLQRLLALRRGANNLGKKVCPRALALMLIIRELINHHLRFLFRGNGDGFAEYM